jgi:hypothetical protein
MTCETLSLYSDPSFLAYPPNEAIVYPRVDHDDDDDDDDLVSHLGGPRMG